MTVPAHVRELLVCPRCRDALADGPEGRSLECRGCGVRYPVRDGIPVLLIDQATPLAPELLNPLLHRHLTPHPVADTLPRHHTR